MRDPALWRGLAIARDNARRTFIDIRYLLNNQGYSGVRKFYFGITRK